MWTAMIALTAVLLAISACAPYRLSDDGNAFLAGFVNQELLALLGVVVTITLASAGNLHLEINKLQDRTNKPFSKTRRSVKLSAYSLIVVFGLGGLLVIVKPMVGDDPRMTAACNSVAIILMAFSLLVLIDLTRTTFKIPASSSLPGGSELTKLREAIDKGKLDQFFAEHKDETGDQAELERVIRSMAGPKEVPEP